jgi:hypothetical protein
MQEIRFENIFIDGTKIEANANKYTFVWKKATDKFENKLQEKIKVILEALPIDLDIKISKVKGKVTVDYISKIIDKLNHSIEVESVKDKYTLFRIRFYKISDYLSVTKL